MFTYVNSRGCQDDMSQKWKSAQIPMEKHSPFKCLFSKAWKQSLAHITSIATKKCIWMSLNFRFTWFSSHLPLKIIIHCVNDQPVSSVTTHSQQSVINLSSHFSLFWGWWPALWALSQKFANRKYFNLNLYPTGKYESFKFFQSIFFSVTFSKQR